MADNIELALRTAREKFGDQPTREDVRYEKYTRRCAACVLSEKRHVGRRNERHCLLLGQRVGLNKGGCDAVV